MYFHELQKEVRKYLLLMGTSMPILQSDCMVNEGCTQTNIYVIIRKFLHATKH